MASCNNLAAHKEDTAPLRITLKMSMLTFSNGATNESRTDSKEGLAKSKSEELEKESKKTVSLRFTFC